MPEAKHIESMVHSEHLGKHPLDAIVVCGMGPMELLPSRTPDTSPVPANAFNEFNAVAAKIMVTKGWAKDAIFSGYRSRKEPRVEARDHIREKELSLSEGALLDHIYHRAHPSKGIHDAPRNGQEGLRNILQGALAQANEQGVIDELAPTTFRNIIEGLNLLGARNADGYFSGSFAVISPRFHGPRIKEMLKCFHLPRAKFLAAKDVLGAVGYNGGKLGFGAKYEALERNAYAGQPVGLQNLRDNPGYVTKELAAIRSPRRFDEISRAVAHYYRDRKNPIALPDCFSLLPDRFDPSFDYQPVKAAFGDVPFSKHVLVGDQKRAQETYQKRAAILSTQTRDYLLS